MKWSIQFRDIPEVVRQRPVTSRLVADVPIGDGDPAAFMEGLDYRSDFFQLPFFWVQ